MPMVKIIYGNKGSGKTKKIIAAANEAAAKMDANVAYLYVNKKYIFELDHQVRFIDTSEYGIKGAYLFLGFINGLVASNFDLKMICVDGFLKHMDRPLDQLDDVICKLNELAKAHEIEIILSVSADLEELTPAMKALVV
jgi:thymidine kinase